MGKAKTLNNVVINMTLKPTQTRAKLSTSSEDLAVQMGKINKWYDSLVPTGGASGNILEWDSDGVAKWVSPSFLDEKVKSTLLAQSTAEGSYRPTFVTGAGTGGVNIIDSFKVNHTPGTTSDVGNTRLVLGNATASGTANNEEGQLKLYSSGTSFHTLKGTTVSSEVIHVLPSTGGTILNHMTTTYTQTSSSSADGAYEIGKIKINGIPTTIYGHDVNTTYTATDGIKIESNVIKHTNSIETAASVFKKISYDAQGHITGTANVTKSDIPALDYVPTSMLTVTKNTNVGITPSSNVFGYVSGLTAAAWNFQQSDGTLFSQYYNDKWQTEIYMDYRTGQMSTRGKNNGTWQDWRIHLDSGNYTSYTVTKTGGGASGTWDINISGSAAKLGTTNKGSATKGIYLSSGTPQEMTYSLGSTVNGGTANKLAYYSGANAISPTPQAGYYEIDSTASTPVSRKILDIRGVGVGNTAAELISGTAGLLSYGDGGPQINFGCGASMSTSGSQEGALIFTDHDSAGSGASWHFVSNQSDWNVTSKRFHARTSISIGSNLPSTSYNLTVKGTSYFDNTITIKGTSSGNASIYYASYGNTRNTPSIRFYDGDVNGQGVQVGGGGLTVLGGGESAQAVFDNLSTLGWSASSEVAIVASDGPIYFMTNTDTFANRKSINIDTSGYLNTGYINMNISDQDNLFTTASSIIYSTSDKYLRRVSLTKLGSILGPYVGPYVTNVGDGTVIHQTNFNSADGTRPVHRYIRSLRPNKLAFTLPANIAIDYSTDSGSNWTSFGYTDAEKAGPFISRHFAGAIAIGPASSAERTTSMQTRITITNDGRDCFIDQFYIWMSTSGHDTTVDIQYTTQSAKTTWVNWRTGVGLAGWSGPNVINVSELRYGNTIYSIRFIFKITSIHADYKTQRGTIYDIQAYGSMGCWTSKNSMMMHDSLYTWDYEQNATFPANVSATKFIGPLQGNADSATTASKLGTSTVGSGSRPIYLNAGTATQCDTPTSGAYWNGVPAVASNGIIEIGKYIDFHASNITTLDYDYRITAESQVLHFSPKSSGDATYNLLQLESPEYNQIRFSTSKTGKAYTSTGIVAYPLTTSGQTMLIQSDGNIVVGGGESPRTLYSNSYDNMDTAENETLYLASDSSEIHFITNCQAYSGRKVLKVQDGQLVKSGGQWIWARDTAPVYANKPNAQDGGYYPAFFAKSKSGGWSMGTLSAQDILYVTYTTDTDYSGGSNTNTYQIEFPTKSGTVALTSDIPSLSGYLPLSGGTMTGDISFATISPSSYPAASKGIKWGGGTDAIDMYYNLRASDAGELIINMRDDANVRTSFAYNGTVKSYIDTDGTYNGNATTSSRSSALYTASVGSSSSTHAGALQTYFEANKSTIVRNQGLGYYSSSYSNGSFYFGYFLSGYNDNPYGGFFVCHYNTPYYVGIQNGAYVQHNLLTNQNYTSHITQLGTVSKGSTYKGIYLDAGVPKEMTYSLYSTVNSGTANCMAYYSGANAISSAAKVTYVNANNSASTPATVSGLHIESPTYGNTAANMIGGVAGVFSYGDGGPQIRFKDASSNQAGALIFTADDAAATGASWHFVSTETDWNVTSKRFHARSGISIGDTKAPVTGSTAMSYALYVNGTANITGNTTMGGNLTFGNSVGIIQTQTSGSNYTTTIKWWSGGTDPGTYGPEIGQWNTGGDSTYPGRIIIMPYHKSYSSGSGPWSNNAGLCIEYNHVYIDGTELSKVGHTHSLSIAADSGTNQLTMYANTKYKITAGGSTYIFTTPPNANYLSNQRDVGITYGANKLEWYDLSANNGTDVTKKQNPTNDWYHHITMHHANSNGYFVDIAACFHSNNIYYRRVANGANASGGWIRLIDSSNIGYITLDATTVNTTAGSFIFGGSSLLGGVNDWAGIQVEGINDRFQLLINGHLMVRQNDDATVSAAGWTAWTSCLRPADVSGSGGITVTQNDVTIGSGSTAATYKGTVTISHSNSITASTSTVFKKFSYDANGHITGTAAVAASDLPSHTHAYLPIAGGTMTGALHVSNTGTLVFDYTTGADAQMFVLNNAVNYGIRYKEGSPDTMKFSASGNANTDAGADLCINGNGDGTVTIRGNTILHAGNYSSYALSTSTKYAIADSVGGSALYGYVPRVTKNSRAFAGKNKAIIEEFTGDSGSTNLPTQHYYHILSIQGSDANWGTQLAMGMTTHGIYYRRYYSGSTWTDWTNLLHVVQTPTDSSYTNYRPLLIGSSNSGTQGFTPTAVTGETYASSNIYCRPSNGTIFASEFCTNTWATASGSDLIQYGLYLKSYYKCADQNQTVIQYNSYGIRTYAGKISSADGILVAVGGGGMTILGSGESADALAGLISNDQVASGYTRLNVGGTLNTSYVGNSEIAIISSDDSIYFITNCQTIANRKPVCLDTSSNFYPGTTETGSIGTSSYKWNTVYAKTLNGELSGPILHTVTNPASESLYYIPFSAGNAATETKYLRVNDGFAYRTWEGTTSVDGGALLSLGNGTGHGTAGNKKGYIRMYSETANFIQITAPGITTRRDIAFQDKSGTVALTSDLGAYLPLAGGTMTGTITHPANTVAINLRNDGTLTWQNTIMTQSNGDEAVVFANANARTSWMFVNGEDSIAHPENNRWQSLTPALQIKGGCVAIGKLIPSGTTPTIKLDIAGSTALTGDIQLKTSGSSSDDSGDIIWYHGNGNEKARIWTDNTYTAAKGPNYRVYKSDGTSLYSGRLATLNECVQVFYSSNYDVSQKGYYAVMTNSASTDSSARRLPTDGQWWHVLSMSWNNGSDDQNNWVSQLALPTYQNRTYGMYWRTNAGSSTALSRDEWVKVLDERNYEGSINYEKFKQPVYLTQPVSPLIRGMIPTVRANRLAFFPGANTLWYTTPNWSTWSLNSAFTDDQKMSLYNDTIRVNLNIGEISSGARTTTMGTRIELRNDSRDTTIDKFVFALNTGYHKVSITIYASKNSDVDTYTKMGETLEVGTWGYQAIINTPSFRFGAGSSNYGRIRIEIRYTYVDSSHQTDHVYINGIAAYSGIYWGQTLYSNMAAFDHLYSWDNSQKAIFPADLKATKFWGMLCPQDNANRRTTANLTCQGYCSMQMFLATSSMTTGKPKGGDGYILDFDWDNTGQYKAQLAIPDTGNSSMSWRGQTGYSDWSNVMCEWRTIVDSHQRYNNTTGTTEYNLTNAATYDFLLITTKPSSANFAEMTTLVPAPKSSGTYKTFVNWPGVIAEASSQPTRTMGGYIKITYTDANTCKISCILADYYLQAGSSVSSGSTSGFTVNIKRVIGMHA